MDAELIWKVYYADPVYGIKTLFITAKTDEEAYEKLTKYIGYEPDFVKIFLAPKEEL